MYVCITDMLTDTVGKWSIRHLYVGCWADYQSKASRQLIQGGARGAWRWWKTEKLSDLPETNLFYFWDVFIKGGNDHITAPLAQKSIFSRLLLINNKYNFPNCTFSISSFADINIHHCPCVKSSPFSQNTTDSRCKKISKEMLQYFVFKKSAVSLFINNKQHEKYFRLGSFLCCK